MPAAFLIHERTQCDHEISMQFMAAEVPEIAGSPLVTDGEENIIKAIYTYNTLVSTELYVPSLQYRRVPLWRNSSVLPSQPAVMSVARR